MPAPPPETGADPPSPIAEPSAADPATAPVAQPAAPAEQGGTQTPGLAESLLGPSVNQHPEKRPAKPVPTEAEAAAAEDAAIAAVYRDLFRPKHNPGRFHILARAQYSMGSSFGNSSLSGRTGGAQVDIGQSFNFIGYALTLRGEGGTIDFGADGRSQMTALLGGGPTLSLGRLGFLQRGYLDFRVGYDFFFAPTRERLLEGGAARLPAMMPHGPRAQLNLGLLLSPDRSRKLFHGVGLGLGYQVLVGSFRGDLPPSQFLQFALHYSGG
ncbi:hypothetical protein SAMN02745121_00395 [Nannocystis exedens]|uniref:Outer membrane protein beta-barrel domain-containing protein n=1 Tax=Nannocystis exedens TaxID=54 RepID=A0A1I1T6M5_9BACT|nr:hypothetical protein [Nannocystis exedens]PCC66877.1 hypothetical protein NAEX_09473 [Nannocystis exedens]SFD51943.1 hypothetical protein SAMN02745121_00395 [Nannocystis exedens]